MRVGTANFYNLASANTYYGKDEAGLKLSEGAIFIGAPSYNHETSRLVINKEGRYFIEDKQDLLG